MANNSRRRAQNFSSLLRTIGSDSQDDILLDDKRDEKNSSILAGRCITTGSSTENSFHSAQTNIVSSTKSSISETNSYAREWNENVISAASFSPTSTTDEYSNDSYSQSTSNSFSGEKEIPQIAELQPSYMIFLRKLAEEMGCLEALPSPKTNQWITQMSETFTKNPDDFKRKLLTIMEVEELSDDLKKNVSENTDGELDLLAQRFVECCKYIHDESMPSMMMKSPINHATYHDENQLVQIAEESPEIIACTVNFSTPKSISPGKSRKIHRKTPVLASGVASPLYMAALKRNATPKTPGTPKGHDSFVMWERFCEENSTPNKKAEMENKINMSPSVALAEKEKFLMKCQEQYESLNNSVIEVEQGEEINEERFSTDLETFDSHPHFLHSSGEEYGTAHSLNSSILEGEDDLTRSIMMEVAKKRQRCHETEKTIREIDAASSSSDSSLQGTGKVLELCEFINKFDEYHRYLREHKGTIKKATRRLSHKYVNSRFDASPRVDEMQMPRMRNNNPTIFTRKQKNPVFQEKPIKAVTPRRRSPQTRSKLTISKKISYSKSPVLSKHGSTSKKINSETKSSNFNLKPSNISSISSTISVSSNVRTSRPTNRSSKLSIPSKSRHQSISPIGTIRDHSDEMNFAYISPELKITTKTPNTKSNSTNLKKSIRSSRVEKTPTMTLSVPTLSITPTLSTEKDITKILKPSTKTNLTPSSPLLPNQTPVQRQFFITPNKSNPSKHVIGAGPRNKPKVYFTGFREVDDYTDVKSPVAAYIRGTDNQLVENFREKLDKLTPKSKGTGTDAHVKI